MRRNLQGPNPEGVSILIADDHEVARRGLRAILESQPDLHVVGEASDGREAVEKAKACAPGVVLMDIGMPEMNGMEATRRIHKDVPSAEVLIITMHLSEELVKEAMQAGAKGYLLKTDADRELITAIRALCRHQTYLSPRLRQDPIDGSADPSQRVAQLTNREYEIVQLLAEGRNNKEVATLLDISVKTVETHRVSIMRKLNIHSLNELVRYAIRNGMIQA